jgi:hypothetical protein
MIYDKLRWFAQEHKTTPERIEVMLAWNRLIWLENELIHARNKAAKEKAAKEKAADEKAAEAEKADEKVAEAEAEKAVSA